VSNVWTTKPFTAETDAEVAVAASLSTLQTFLYAEQKRLDRLEKRLSSPSRVVNGGSSGDIVVDSITIDSLNGILIATAGLVSASAQIGDLRISDLAWGKITGTPTTLAGYGITDAQPLDDDLTAISALGTTGYLSRTGANTWALSSTILWSSISGTPTTLVGYGIVDAQPLDADLTQIAGLARTRGDLIIGGAASWADLAIGASGQYLRSDGTDPSWATISAADLPGSFSGFANPTGTIGLIANNGVASTATRSDGTPALSQAIVPTWTGVHTFSAGLISTTGAFSGAVGVAGVLSSTGTGLNAVVRLDNATPTNGKQWDLYSLNDGTFGIYSNTNSSYIAQSSNSLWTFPIPVTITGAATGTAGFVSGNDDGLVRTVNNGFLALSGSNTTSTGANILLYGSAHATLPNYWRIRRGTTIDLEWNGASIAFTPAVTMVSTLNVTDLITASGGVYIEGGAFAPGRIYRTAGSGLVLAGRTGSTNDLQIVGASGGDILLVPTGTTTAAFQGAVTAASTLVVTGGLTNTVLSGTGVRLVTSTAAGLLGNSTSIAGNYAFSGIITAPTFTNNSTYTTATFNAESTGSPYFIGRDGATIKYEFHPTSMTVAPNAAFSGVVTLSALGGGGSSALQLVGGSANSILLRNNGSDSDEKSWGLLNSGGVDGTFAVVAYSDNYASSESPLEFTRSGTGVVSAEINADIIYLGNDDDSNFVMIGSGDPDFDLTISRSKASNFVGMKVMNEDGSGTDAHAIIRIEAQDSDSGNTILQFVNAGFIYQLGQHAADGNSLKVEVGNGVFGSGVNTSPLFEIDGYNTNSIIHHIVGQFNAGAVFAGGGDVLNHYEEEEWTATLTGMSSATTTDAYAVRVGKVVTITIYGQSGTSNSSSFTITGVPAAFRPSSDQLGSMALFVNNGANSMGTMIAKTTGVIECYPLAWVSPVLGLSSWVSSGTKGFYTLSITYTKE
jgi:hypothetical protein